MFYYFYKKGSEDIYNYELVYGIIALLLGIVIIVGNQMIGALLRMAIGIWILYNGVIRLGLAVKLQKLNPDNKIWISMLILAIVILFCGIYIIATPGIVMVTIGIVMIVYAIMDIIEEIIFMRNVKDLA